MTDLKKLEQQIIEMFDDEIAFDEAQQQLLIDSKINNKYLPDIVSNKLFKRKSSAISFNAQNKSVLIEQYSLEGKESNIFIVILNDFLDSKPLVKILNKTQESERFYFALKSKLDFFRN